MDSTKPTPEKVLKMYCANYQSLDEQDHDQLMTILKEIYRSLMHHPEKNFIFFCEELRSRVIPILITNGFVPSTVEVRKLVHFKAPIIAW